MTAKDFRIIAESIRSARISNYTDNPNRAAYLNGVDNVTAYLADSLARTNERFDRERFIAVCTSGKESK